MRPTSPTGEASRLYRTLTGRAGVYDTRQMLRDDVTHATEHGYDPYPPMATLAAFEGLMAADGYNLEQES